MEPHINCQEFQFYVYKTCDNVFFSVKFVKMLENNSSRKWQILKCSQNEKQTIKLHYVKWLCITCFIIIQLLTTYIINTSS